MKVEFLPFPFENANTRKYFVFGKVQRKRIWNPPFLLLFSLRKITQSKSNYLLYKNEILVMPNILSLTCICFNSILCPTSFFLRQITQSLCHFQPNCGCYAYHTCTLFSISVCLESRCKFSIKSLLFCLLN
jgi:hypothetical protein